MKNKYSNIQMKSQKFNTLLINKKSFTVSFLVMLFLIVLLPMTTSAQQCSLTLTAKNNIESVNSEGRVYFMILLKVLM